MDSGSPEGVTVLLNGARSATVAAVAFCAAIHRAAKSGGTIRPSTISALLVSHDDHVGVDSVAAQQVSEGVRVTAMIEGTDLAVGQVEVHHKAAPFEYDSSLEAVPAQVIREHPGVRFAMELAAVPGRANIVHLEAEVHRVNHDRGAVVNHMPLHMMLDRWTMATEVAHANSNARSGSVRNHRHRQAKNQNGRK